MGIFFVGKYGKGRFGCITLSHVRICVVNRARPFLDDVDVIDLCSVDWDDFDF